MMLRAFLPFFILLVVSMTNIGREAPLSQTDWLAITQTQDCLRKLGASFNILVADVYYQQGDTGLRKVELFWVKDKGLVEISWPVKE